MKFYSTNNTSYKVDLKTAVINSLPPDNGLYMPESIPRLSGDFIKNLDDFSFQEIAFAVCKQYLSEDLGDDQIRNIVDTSINFPAPLISLSSRLKSLELWHGPSLAFKDFGARFMAGLMGKLVEGESKHLDILVATSGDTGGAVAAGFYDVPNIRVTILYPSGKVSLLQEKQLTTLGKNIDALEIEGTFDDCQALVKKAFLDKELSNTLNLSSANSINIARLIPQSFYYFEAFKQVDKGKRDNVVYCVPSGNFGNLTAGLLAKRMGLPCKKMIAATNINNAVPRYLSTGLYEPIPSFTTISNAMDVGNPSNFKRLLHLYDGRRDHMANDIEAFYYNDEATKECLKTTQKKYGYIADPHGAVGFLAAEKYLEIFPDSIIINLETAHPSKFLDVMQSEGIAVDVPERLKILENRKKISHLLSISFADFKEYLINR